MKKLIIGCAVVATALSVGIGSASATAPVVPGCVGESISANAKAPGPYGVFVRSLATVDGIAGEVHLLQAGLIPDGAYPNTCNG